VRSQLCVGLFCGDPALWLPQAAKSGALGVGILSHPCSLNRGKPLDAPPCREVATHRALCSGDPAFAPCFSSARGCSRVSRPAAPPRAAATTSPWRCLARRHSMSCRALRLVFLEAGLRAVGLFFCAGTIVRASRVVHTPVPRPGNVAPLSLRSSRGAAVFRRCALRAVPSCEPAFELSRPCVEC
jgi:hypothetical protein